MREYVINCWHCGAPFDAVEAPFCNHPDATKICPFCLNCFCDAPWAFRDGFVKNSPQELLEDKMRAQEGGARKLGELLINAGKITPAQLDKAIELHRINKRQLGEVLVMMKLVTKDELNIFLIGQKEMDEIDLKNFKLNLALVEKMGHVLCTRYKFIPLELVESEKETIFRFAVPSKEAYIDLKQSNKLSRYVLIPYQADPSLVNALLEEINEDNEFLSM
jgi:hypothetical protein